MNQAPVGAADSAAGKVSSMTDLEGRLSAILNARLGWRRLGLFVACSPIHEEID